MATNSSGKKKPIYIRAWHKLIKIWKKTFGNHQSTMPLSSIKDESFADSKKIEENKIAESPNKEKYVELPRENKNVESTDEEQKTKSPEEEKNIKSPDVDTFEPDFTGKSSESLKKDRFSLLNEIDQQIIQIAPASEFGPIKQESEPIIPLVTDTEEKKFENLTKFSRNEEKPTQHQSILPTDVTEPEKQAIKSSSPINPESQKSSSIDVGSEDTSLHKEYQNTPPSTDTAESATSSSVEQNKKNSGNQAIGDNNIITNVKEKDLSEPQIVLVESPKEDLAMNTDKIRMEDIINNLTSDQENRERDKVKEETKDNSPLEKIANAEKMYQTKGITSNEEEETVESTLIKEKEITPEESKKDNELVLKSQEGRELGPFAEALKGSNKNALSSEKLEMEDGQAVGRLEEGKTKDQEKECGSKEQESSSSFFSIKGLTEAAFVGISTIATAVLFKEKPGKKKDKDKDKIISNYLKDSKSEINQETFISNDKIPEELAKAPEPEHLEQKKQSELTLNGVQENESQKNNLVASIQEPRPIDTSAENIETKPLEEENYSTDLTKEEKKFETMSSSSNVDIINVKDFTRSQKNSNESTELGKILNEPERRIEKKELSPKSQMSPGIETNSSVISETNEETGYIEEDPYANISSPFKEQKDIEYMVEGMMRESILLERPQQPKSSMNELPPTESSEQKSSENKPLETADVIIQAAVKEVEEAGRLYSQQMEEKVAAIIERAKERLLELHHRK